ncbi:MAG: GGDEF domain-containing protein [Methylotenera sp.]|nr:GGDEF domain-containing protein [Oligoflexia bacterium]
MKGIRQLLTHLHGEVSALEDNYSQVLLVLRKIENAADVDDLSGLLRRKAFFRKWEALLMDCLQAGENCGVLLVDIDHFKKVNDTHGHQTGDEVIKKVSALLKQFESPACVTGRYGGEEFAIAVKGTDAEILGMAEMIRRGAERLHGPVVGVDNVEWKCTVSVGVAHAKKDGYESTKLLKSADDALYDAKRRGRNQVRTAA